MRLITLLITVVALAVAAPAIADKGGTPNGGNGGGGGGGGDTSTATPTPTPDTTTSGSNGKNTASPSITIASVNGARMDGSSQPQPAHGSTVAFDTTAGSLAGWEHPMVALRCYQDNELVYIVLDQPDATFVVGGGGSGWTAGAATCNGTLYAYGWKGGQESIRELAGTYDWTAAW